MLLPYHHTHKKELVAGKNENLSHNFHLFLFKLVPGFERLDKRLCCGTHAFTHTCIFSVLDKLL